MRRSRHSSFALRILLTSAALACVVPLACASGTTDEASAGGAGGEGGAGSAQSSSSGSDGPCVFAADCISFTDACNIGTCINGVCTKAPANDGVACDDGKTCTESDLCQAGKCTGTLKYCPASDSCHVGVCDVETDSCVEMAGNDGKPCVDQDPCTASSVCQSGSCVGTMATNCSFLNGQCSIGMCDSALGCVSVPTNDGTKCDDGFFCTVDDTCKAGVCGGSPNPCAAPSNVCQVASCNEAKDVCESVPGNNGAACDDKSACTTGETCSNGTCGGGQPTNNGMTCDDKNACTTGEACSNGTCGGGAAVVACQSGDGCCPAGCDFVNDDDCGGTVYAMGMGALFGFIAYDIPTNTWSMLPTPPVPTYSQLTTDGTHVLLLGIDNLIYSFDPPSNVWSSVGKGPGFESSQPYGFFKWTPAGYYYVKDGQSTLEYSDGLAAWTPVPLPIPASCAGTFDPSSGNLYIRIFGSMGVMVYNTAMNAVTQSFPVPFAVSESSRTGSYYGGFFYSRDIMSAFYKISTTNGSAMALNANPAELHTSSDVDLSKGIIYIGGYKPTGTKFQSYNAVTNTLSTLASMPIPFPDSTLVVVK